MAVVAVALTPAHADPPGKSSIVLDADPAEITVSPLPCDTRGEVELGMVNSGSEGRFVDGLLSASSGLELDRELWSTYVPADEQHRVTAPLKVTASAGTRPGDYRASLSVEESRLDIGVTVVDPPGDDADENLALYRQAFASSIHPNTTLCGGVDGSSDSDLWAENGSHDRTEGEFPDIYGVELDRTYSVGRVEVHTLDSEQYPAAEMGIRDFEIQVHDEHAWRTVASVEGNEQGHVSSEFPPVPADRVRVVTHDSNDQRFSRIVELEVYQE